MASVAIERYTGVDSSYERPALVEIRKRNDAGRYKALVCYSTDRLARTPEELLAIVSDGKRCGCKTLFVKNPSPETREGKLLLFISGYDPDPVMVGVSDQANTAFLAKPFTGSALLEQVRQLAPLRDDASRYR